MATEEGDALLQGAGPGGPPQGRQLRGPHPLHQGSRRGDAPGRAAVVGAEVQRAEATGDPADEVVAGPVPGQRGGVLDLVERQVVGGQARSQPDPAVGLVAGVDLGRHQERLGGQRIALGDPGA